VLTRAVNVQKCIPSKKGSVKSEEFWEVRSRSLRCRSTVWAVLPSVRPRFPEKTLRASLAAALQNVGMKRNEAVLRTQGR